jgi:hypothetical protein
VPIRTFADWHAPAPGLVVEAHRVTHSGADPSGSFLQTLVLTNVACGSTEFMALVVRDAAFVVEALAPAACDAPVPTSRP